MEKKLSKQNIGVGVAGTGFIGPAHVEGLRRNGITVMGLAEENKEKAEQKAAELGIPQSYGSLDAMLADPNINVVHLATPNYLHYPHAKAALLAGKHVICEKPLAMNTKESGELVKLAADKKLVNAVNFNIRMYPMSQQARSMVQSGQLGDIFILQGSYLQDWLLLPTDLTGLTEGTLYYVNTKANNIMGWNNSGGEKTFLTKPLPPTGLSVQANSSSMIYLSWVKSVSADRTIIERSDTPTWSRGQGVEIYNGTGTHYENSGLQPAHHYYYQAWSYCAEAGFHQYSDAYTTADTTTPVICGDANGDNIINVGDVVYLINYLFKGGNPPIPANCVGDCNGDGIVNVGDVVYIINYLFKGGTVPGGCCQ